ncbi:MAG: ribosome silencing factor [Marinilabiliaceae bacterium]
MSEIKNALVDAIVEGMRDRKAKKITILDLRGLDGATTDFCVICEGNSTTHVDSIGDAVEDRVREDVGEKPLHYEGRANCEWILVDYHDVVAHIFLPEKREFYNIEGLWADARRTDLPDDV